MSTQVFPSLPGITFNIERVQQWNTQIQDAVSGKETRVAYWTAARYQWTLTFEFLRSSTAFNEFQTLWGFVSARQGRFDSFQYTDSEDNSVVGQAIATGDSTTTQFQMYRAYGISGLTEPVLAPNTVTRVLVGGSSVSSTTYNINYWGSSAPGTILFSTTAIPANGNAIAADFSYYFPCRFDEDNVTFVEFMYKLWENKKIIMRSIK